MWTFIIFYGDSSRPRIIRIAKETAIQYDILVSFEFNIYKVCVLHLMYVYLRMLLACPGHGTVDTNSQNLTQCRESYGPVAFIGVYLYGTSAVEKGQMTKSKEKLWYLLTFCLDPWTMVWIFGTLRTNHYDNQFNVVNSWMVFVIDNKNFHI